MVIQSKSLFFFHVSRYAAASLLLYKEISCLKETESGQEVN